MALFGFGKKKEALAPCDCGGMCKSAESAATEIAESAQNTACHGGDNRPAKSVAEAERATVGGAAVKVLGSGCAKCNALEAATVEALKALQMDPAIDHVTDFAQIAAYGVMTTPALVVDGQVVSFGRVLKKDEVISILKNARR
ncbi:MAG: thioredoxin family protein [Clostridia bacterium]